MNIYDILGPVMVGPSSSHTAGAVKIGLIARKILNDIPQNAEILLHGSFSTTGKGHGTDKALIAGLLDMHMDDERIPFSFDIAEKEGLSFCFHPQYIKDAHPNTALLHVKGKNGGEISLQASSIGGGRIMIDKLDDIFVRFSAEKPTILIKNEDTPGHVAKVTTILAEANINIATMQLYRSDEADYAIMAIELDEKIEKNILFDVAAQEGIIKAIYINMEEEINVI